MTDVDLNAVGCPQKGLPLDELMKERMPAAAGVSAFTKRAVDAALAFVALLVLSPLLAMACTSLFIIQGGPIFVTQKRVGRRGVMFSCLKFRTMVCNGEEVLARHLALNPSEQQEWEASRKLKADPRVTPFGALLRKSSLDELPQLFNVLVGDMSMVGPRPITLAEAEFYGSHFRDYLSVRPGLTGLWQISGRSDTSYAERVKLDVTYVANHSLWGDFTIMAKTIPAVLLARGSY
jgi:exopolysaccharide production protein ExoY